MKDHEHPKCLDSAMAMLPSGEGVPVVLAKAQYSPNSEKTERVFLFLVHGGALRTVFDAWLRAEDIPKFVELIQERRELMMGSCDAMYATHPLFVWAKIGNQLQVWRKGLLHGTFTSEIVTLRRALSFGWKRASVKSFDCCYAFLSATWVTRGVKLTRSLGASWIVATQKELMAVADPTYDGIDLLCDAAWAGYLAKSLSDVTGLQLKIHEDLL